jgi:hypothetical protein
MTDPDVTRLFCTVRATKWKNSEGTEITVGLDHLTRLENILSYGLPMDVLYIYSKEKQISC